MSSSNKLHVSSVIQKALLEVDEAGSEAAAATAAVMVGAAAPGAKPAKKIVFRADRPFLYFIRHKPSKTTLFMGWVADPR